MAFTTSASVRRLTRTDDGLTGVAGGIAEYTGMDPEWVRVGIIAGSLLTFPVLPIVYVAAWLIIPKKEPASPPPTRPSDTGAAGAANAARDAHDAAAAKAQARAEVEAIDPMWPGPMHR